jgi:hypothetical protein
MTGPVFLDSSRVAWGRFLLWRWERWSISGGAGVEWWCCGRPVRMPGWSPLWNLVR